MRILKYVLTVFLVFVTQLIIAQVITPHYFEAGSYNFNWAKKAGLDKTVELVSSRPWTWSEISQEEEYYNEPKQYQINIMSLDTIQLADTSGKVYWTKKYPEAGRTFDGWYENMVEPPAFPYLNDDHYSVRSDGRIVLYRAKGNRYFIWDKEGKEYLFPENTGDMNYYGQVDGKWVFCGPQLEYDEGDEDVETISNPYVCIYDENLKLIRKITTQGIRDCSKIIVAPYLKYFLFLTDVSLQFYDAKGRMYKEHIPCPARLSDYRFSKSGDIFLPDYWTHDALIDMTTGEVVATFDAIPFKFTDRDVGLAILGGGDRVMVVNYLTGEVLYAQFWMKGKRINNCKLKPDGTELSYVTNPDGQDITWGVDNNLVLETYRFIK